MKKTLKKLTSWLCLAAMLMSMLPATVVPAFAAEAAHEDHANHAEWTEVAAGGTIPNSGNVVLTGNVTPTGTIAVTDDLHICLNGKTINLSSLTGKALFTVAAGAELTICDCVGTGVIGDTSGVAVVALNSVLINVADGGTFNLYGGTIAGIKGASLGAVVQTNGASVFNMYGGTIAKNEGTYWGGAVCLRGTSTFNMYGGTFSENKCSGAGGGGAICFQTAATANIEDGTFVNNTATASHGGAINVANGGVLNISGGTFTGNTRASGKQGGAVYAPKGTVNISGGTFDGTGTGGVHLSGVTATISGGTLAALSTHNAVLTISGSTKANLTTVSGTLELHLEELAGGATITTSVTANSTDSTVKAVTGGYAYAAPELTADSFASGTAKLTEYHNLSTAITLPAGNDYILDLNGQTLGVAAKGSQIVVPAGATLTVKDGTGNGVFEGTSANGVPLFKVSGDLVLEGGTIKGNAGGNQGGVVQMSDTSSFTMTGGTITENSSGYYGGVFCVMSGATSTIDITGGTISNNTAGGPGGVLYVYGAVELNVSNAVFSGNEGGKTTNTASHKRGGVFYTSATSTLVIKNSTFTGNSAYEAAVAYVPGGSVDIIGSTFQNNTSTINGAVHLSNADTIVEDSTFTGNNGLCDLSVYNGSVDIIGSTKIDQLNSSGAPVLTLGTLTEGASITSNVAIDTSNAADYKQLSDYVYIYDDPAGLTAADFEDGEVKLDKDVDVFEAITLAAGKEYVLDLNGNTLSVAAPGVQFVVPADAKLTVKDGAGNGVFAGTATNKVPLFVVNGDLVLESGTIKGNAGANQGGVVQMNGTSNFAMTGGTITGNSSGHYGGVFCVMSGATSTIDITGGTISNNTAPGPGGVLYTYGTVDLSISDATISGNKAGATGGAIHTSATSTLTIEDSTFTNNTATGNGGALYVGGTVDIANSTFTGSDGAVGDAAYFANATVTISNSKLDGVTQFQNGTAEITGKTTIENVGSYGKTALTLKDLTEGASITTGVLAAATTVDATHSTVKQYGNQYTYRDPSEAADLTAADFEDGEVKLEDDIAMSSAIELSAGDYILDLNGKTLSVSVPGSQFVVPEGATLTVRDSVGNGVFKGLATNGFPLFNVSGDLVLESGTIKGNAGGNLGGVVQMNGTSNFAMTGGTITGNSSGYYGGVFCVMSGATSTIDITGGTISNNTAPGPGGVLYVNGAVELNVSNAVISGNKAGTRGGAFYLANDSELTITSGTFTGNSANDEGLAVYATGCMVDITGGTFQNNTTSTDGFGAVYLTNADAVISDSTFTGNSGCDVGVHASVLEISGSTEIGQMNVYDETSEVSLGALTDGASIKSNAALNTDHATDCKQTGEFVYVYADPNTAPELTAADFESGAVTLERDTLVPETITLTAGTADAVAVYTLDLNGKSLTLDAAGKMFVVPEYAKLIITDGTAGEDGIGTGIIVGLTENTSTLIEVAADGKLELQGGIIRGNTASTGDGGAIVNAGTLTITGGKFENNKSAKGHGGAIATTGDLVITGGTFTGNSSGDSTSNNAGAIYVVGGTATIEGGSFTENITQNQGGAIYFVNASATITGGTFTASSSSKTGSDVASFNSDLTISGATVIDQLRSFGESYTLTLGALTEDASITVWADDVVDTGSLEEGTDFSVTEVTISDKAYLCYTAAKEIVEPEPEPEPAKFTVTYDDNGGEGAPEAQTKTEDVDLPLSAVEPTRANYKFLGWATEANGEVVYAPGETYTANAHVTLYAVWELAIAKGTLSITTNLGNALCMKFAAKVSDVEKTGAVAMEFTRQRFTDGVETTEVVTKTLADATVEGNYYVFVYENIAAKEMGDTIRAVMKNSAGQEVSEPRETSIASYLYGQLEKKATSTDAVSGYLRTLIVDMLNYGAEAQTYFKYNTANLVNADLTEAQKAYGTQGTPSYEGIPSKRETTYGAGFESSGAIMGVTYTLGAEISQKVAVKKSYLEGGTVEISVTNYRGEKKTIVVPSSEATVDGSYLVFVNDAVVSADGRQEVTFTFRNAGGDLVGTTKDSLASYINRQAIKDNEKYGWAHAIIKFSDAAKLYLLNK